MTRAGANPADAARAAETQRDRIAELEARVAQLQKINDALMNRVERDTDRQGNSYSLFQAAIALEFQVNERTAALSRTLITLEATNRDLQAANEAAQAASHAKSAFLAAMSHELRTPMNGVVGMTELLLHSELNGAQRGSLGTIRDSARSLLTILNDILDFSKIEAGQLRIESMRFELCRASQDVLDLLRPQIDAKGLELVVEFPTPYTLEVMGDPVRFKQILINLVGNALKFTERGEVRVSVQVQDDGSDFIGCRFTVADSGIGIQPEVIPTLFRSFTQADSSTTRKYGGTGLGLAIVQKLCDLMGGECGVTSEYGRGSQFWFALRLKRAALAPDTDAIGSQRKLDETGIDARRLRFLGTHVLLAEDNAVNQLVASALLRALGCSCEVARNGREVIEALLRNPNSFDLVLMDCQMPEMDGYEATRRIRELEVPGATERLSVVALTANAMSGDREACLAAGMDDFLSKPFQLSDLSAMLDKWRRNRGAKALDA